MLLLENTIIEFDSVSSEELVIERILWISKDKSEVVLMNSLICRLISMITSSYNSLRG